MLYFGGNQEPVSRRISAQNNIEYTASQLAFRDCKNYRHGSSTKTFSLKLSPFGGVGMYSEVEPLKSHFTVNTSRNNFLVATLKICHGENQSHLAIYTLSGKKVPLMFLP